MIEGVKIKKLKRFSDDRGYLTEVLKENEDTFVQVKQTTYTESYPGVIKAFHWHKNQTDVWFVIKGEAQVVMYDKREGSSTNDETQVVYAGESNPCIILIPRGVAHGYRVLGTEKVGLLYHTDQAYNPSDPDEERIPHDDSSIGFDWATESK
ncbi:MAG: dTDP-4-dehydrorhamnose 3,5-epimerase family protein [Candidatus Jacksonbacteria bacterium]|jgi:dTDP-4-dehydrorhamnose 3,5-epimerase|nr:dTDP-4-dehydrorhamnose 3,5-epimerase family protein [Candidatus Jacksonbacteria bacterium]MBT6034049.1 dTDP-4-dehydrorhamnose 3,5-epimerase family protein [Candidatus Jacksonbacteria bacterium]MBT6301529.1 dTDP-4-dehydrorhamnose 3,5-epimerase family protein [Candidatus Jacksonbacteria bacterium]MBT6757580.1 dTDP-4-dehydrorhamnose 3,5-epimerase family protein [Candidatus Jacksonbacteria bacterium]MBT6955310.1 dTDP-4-dehydrorhamnose 3,5-epimerase family protein [Candidatus Jacksonbacteria bact